MGASQSANIILRIAEGALERGISDKPPGSLSAVTDISTKHNLHLRILQSSQSLGPLVARTVEPTIHSYAISNPDDAWGTLLRSVLKQEVAAAVKSQQGSAEFDCFMTRARVYGMNTPADVVNAIAFSIDANVTPQLITRKAAYFSTCKDGTPVLNIVGKIRPEHAAAARRSVQGMYAAATASALMDALANDVRTAFIVEDLIATSNADASIERTVIIIVFVTIVSIVAAAAFHSAHIYGHHRFALSQM